MFERIRTSLTRPKLTIYFMKDSWGKVIRHLLFVPLFLLLPLVLSLLVSPGMSFDRYVKMNEAIKTDFRMNAVIEDGLLTYQEAALARFDHFTLHMGHPPSMFSSFSLVFEPEHLVLYAANVEMARNTYIDLGLTQHDFSSMSTADTSHLSLVVQTFIEAQPILVFIDFNITYLAGLVDYLLMAFLMSILMMLFVYRVQLPYNYRFKLSIYLTSCHVFLQLLLILFSLQALSFLNLLVVYMYHVWTFRSIQTLPRGVQ